MRKRQIITERERDGEDRQCRTENGDQRADKMENDKLLAPVL